MGYILLIPSSELLAGAILFCFEWLHCINRYAQVHSYDWHNSLSYSKEHDIYKQFLCVFEFQEDVNFVMIFIGFIT